MASTFNITFEGKAVPIPKQQIEAIRYYLDEKSIEHSEDIVWEKGKQVEIISGSMAGLTGELVNFKGRHKINVEIGCF